MLNSVKAFKASAALVCYGPRRKENSFHVAFILHTRNPFEFDVLFISFFMKSPLNNMQYLYVSQLRKHG
jgi:hypothetical protein